MQPGSPPHIHIVARCQQPSPSSWRWFPLCVVWLVSLSPHMAGAADDPNDRFVAALLDRQLVHVVENEALRRLGDDLLKPAERVNWTLRLARGYMGHAPLATGPDREDLVRRAAELLTGLLNHQPPLPRQAAIRVQQALLVAEAAQVRLWEWEAGAPGAASPGEIAAGLRSASEQLRTVLATLPDEVRAAAKRTPAQLADGELSTSEVRQLEREASLQLASTLVGFVTISPDSADRTAARRDAEQSLKDLADGWSGDFTTWEARLLRGRLARLRGDFGAATSLLQSALSAGPAAWLADRFLAELVRVQLDSGQLDVALKTLTDRSQQQGRLGEELSYLLIDACLRASRVAADKRDETTSRELWLRAEAATNQLSGSWGARAQLRLAREREAVRYGPEVAALVQSARQAYQAGDVTQADALFQQATERALATQQTLAAEEFDYTRGSILLQAERYEAAAAAFESLIRRSPVGARTQEADLLRAYAWGRVYQAAPTRTNRERYAAALAEHRRQYAGTPSAAEATWMLAAFEEGRNQWTEALPLYLALSTDPTHGLEAQVRAAILYEQILHRLRETQQPVATWEDQAVEELAALVRRFPASPAAWTPAHADVCTRLVRIVLLHREHPYAEADRLLAPVLQAGDTQRRLAERDGTPLADAWAQQLRLAEQLRVVSLAGQGRIEEARELFDHLAVADPLVLLGLLQGLTELANQIPPAQRTALAHLQLQTAQRLRDQRAELTDEQRRRLDECRADAYLASGNVIDAAAIYESLLQGPAPTSQRVKQVAELLERQGTPQSLARAKTYWGQIERSERPGTSGWIEARLHIAQCALQLGQLDEVRKLIALTRLAYPTLGGPPWLAQFDRLAAELDR